MRLTTAVFADIESECAAIPLLRIQLTSLVPRSAAHVHKLETHAQRTLMMMTSYDPDSNVIQCYNASALPADGWSQLRPSLILAGGYKVLVTTMTVYKGNLGVEAQPSLARNDFVFGPDGFKVSWLCTPIAMWVAYPEQGGCRCTVICNQLMLHVWFSTDTESFGQGNSCHGDSQNHPSGPSRPPRYARVQ